MATPSQRFFSPTHTLSGSGIPVARPLSSYTPNPVPDPLVVHRSNYPSNSHIDSRESLSERPPPLGAYRFIETAGAAAYRPVHLPGESHRPATQRAPLPDIELERGADGVLRVPHRPREQHPNFSTTSNAHGSQPPERRVTQEYRYYPRAHTFTNTFSAGNYRSYGLTTAKDEVRVHRVEYFSTP